MAPPGSSRPSLTYTGSDLGGIAPSDYPMFESLLPTRSGPSAFAETPRYMANIKPTFDLRLRAQRKGAEVSRRLHAARSRGLYDNVAPAKPPHS
jgi:hypothetical protein